MSLAAKKIGVLSVVIGSVSIVRDSSSIKAETKSKVFEDDLVLDSEFPHKYYFFLNNSKNYFFFYF